MIDRRIIIFFDKKTFYKELLDAAYLSLEQKNNPLRFNSFCLGYRELIDLYIKDCSKGLKEESIFETSWFSKNNQEYFSKDRITRIASLRYQLAKGLSDDFIKTFIPEFFFHIKKFKDLYSDLSDYVHVKEESFNLSEEHLTQGVNKIEETVLNLIDIYNNLLGIVGENFIEKYATLMNEYVMKHGIEEIDCLSSSGYYVDEFYCEQIKIISGCEKGLYIAVLGTVYFESYHGHGEDADTIRDHYPFSANFLISLEDGFEIKEMRDINVDTSSFYQ